MNIKLIAGLVAAAVVLGTLFAIYHAIDEHAYLRGKAEVMVKWKEANEEAARNEREAREERERHAREQSAKLATAEQEAEDWYAAWRAASSKPKGPLATCTPVPVQAAEVVGGGAGGNAAGGLRARITFTAEFVRIYDGAWTGTEGKPVFEYPAGSLEAALAADPVGPEDVTRVHGENAQRCSATRRQLNTLLDLIERERDKGG